MTDHPTGSTDKAMTTAEWSAELQGRHPTFAEVTDTYRTWDDLHNLTPTDERNQKTDG